MTYLQQDEFFMRRAIGLAKEAWGQTHPNPLVGAVIVEGGEVVAEGFHAHDGGPHAERVALANLGRAPKPDATLYVTLEPCSTHGRTGACCEAIHTAGIRRVVVGATDPNPLHAGKGFEWLRERNIEVVTDALSRKCSDLNLIFNHWITTGSPLFAAKVATTLDGKIATRTGDSKWITGEGARAHVHVWRRYFPSIAVGAMTVMKDNPKLTARIAGCEEWCPLRFVFDGLLRSVANDQLPAVYTDDFRERTIVVTTQHGYARSREKLRDLGVQVWLFESPEPRVNWADFKTKCRQEKINGVYFEGGAQLVSALLKSRELDYLFAYRAPLLFADNDAKPVFSGLTPDNLMQAVRLKNVRNETIGDDSLTRGNIKYPLGG